MSRNIACINDQDFFLIRKKLSPLSYGSYCNDEKICPLSCDSSNNFSENDKRCKHLPLLSHGHEILSLNISFNTARDITRHCKM